MEKIEHWEFLVSLAISWRKIDVHATVCVGTVGMIPYGANLSMSHVVYLVVISTAIAHIEDAEYVAYIPAGERIGWVDACYSIYVEAIGVHF